MGCAPGSQATVLRALRRRGLIQPPRALRESRELAQQRRAAFVAPVAAQPGLAVAFSQFETAGGGTSNLGGLVDFHAKLALACPITATGRSSHLLGRLSLRTSA